MNRDDILDIIMKDEKDTGDLGQGFPVSFFAAARRQSLCSPGILGLAYIMIRRCS